MRKWSKAALLLSLCLGGPAARAGTVMTLADALRTARERQPLLAQSRAATEAARARVDEARSGYRPQVVGALGYQRTTGNVVPRPASSGPPIVANNKFDLYNSFTSSLTLSQLIYDFGQTSGRTEAAEGNAAAAQLSERTQALQVDVLVRVAYFQARASKALLGVAQETLANLSKHLDQIQGFVEVGTRPEIDLAQARTDLANGRAALIDAENNYAQARATLNQTIGVVASTDYDVADETMPEVPGEEAPLDQLAAEAEKGRPELQSLQEQVRAQLATARSVEGALWPTLSAGAGLTAGAVKVDDPGWNAQVGLSLNWALYQGGLTTAQLHETQALVAQLVAQVEQQRLQVRLDVEQARLSVRAGKSQLLAVRDALVNARERLRLAEGRYQTGAGNVIELGDAQVALTNAEAQIVQADDRLATARAQLVRALARQ